MTKAGTRRFGYIGIAGTGRVAKALGRFLIERGQPVMAIGGRNPERTAQAASFLNPCTTPVKIQDLPSIASHILIAVSDAAVEPVAGLLARSGFRHGIALHTCGAKGPELLNVLARRGVHCGSLHPMQSFATPEQGLTSLPGSFFAIDGDSAALQWASVLVWLLRGRSIRVSPENRCLYHAASVMAGNYVAALVHSAVELLQAAGIENLTALNALAPLVRTSVENCFQVGPIKALTGPIQRGDLATVITHLNELKKQPGAVESLYCSAGRLAAEMARRRGLPESEAAQIEGILLAQ
ncbi:MAG TPA: DUF2520 domain-containing protein [Bryobacteraceae bacterium]|nr:DUF2520 domain-containing protein [Bryobacteraceae bacterium]